MLKNLENYLYKKFLDSDWGIVWRNNSMDDFPFKRNKSAFKPLPNNEDYWFADPMLIEREKQVYLFAEAFSRKDERGHICRFLYDGERFTDFKIVIMNDYHMSYPFVFEHGENIYMIPETKQNRSIDLYVASFFPDTWEKKITLISNIYAVDTTVINVNGSWKLLTYVVGEAESKLQIYDFDVEETTLELKSEMVDVNKSLRSAGQFVVRGEELFRPSQQCKRRYGGGLCINRVTSARPYSEQLIKEITPQDIVLSDGKVFKGIHTYSQTAGIEVIDVLYGNKINVCKSILLKGKRV